MCGSLLRHRSGSQGIKQNKKKYWLYYCDIAIFLLILLTKSNLYVLLYIFWGVLRGQSIIMMSLVQGTVIIITLLKIHRNIKTFYTKTGWKLESQNSHSSIQSHQYRNNTWMHEGDMGTIWPVVHHTYWQWSRWRYKQFMRQTHTAWVFLSPIHMELVWPQNQMKFRNPPCLCFLWHIHTE